MIRVKYPKRWDETHPSDFYEGVAEYLPDGTVRCKWDGIDGFFICEPSKVIIIDQNPPDPVAELLQLMRTCNTSQVRRQLLLDSDPNDPLHRIAIIRSFYLAAAALPKSDTPPDEA